MGLACWFCRDKSIFEQYEGSKFGTAAGFIRLVDDYIHYNESIHCSGPSTGCMFVLHHQSGLRAPPIGWVKVNANAHVISGVKTSLGAAIRCSSGELLVIETPNVEPTCVLYAEAMVARYGLELARRFGYDQVILQLDALRVVNGIMSSAVDNGPVVSIYYDIKNLVTSMSSFSCKHIKKIGNTVAHLVARWEVSHCNEVVFLSPFPQSIITLAGLDI